jgi:adenylate cyclase
MAACEGYVFRELDRVLVVGKKEPVRIYEPLAKTGEFSVLQQQELDDYQQALQQYHQQNWQTAKLAFQQLFAQHQHILYENYTQRCDLFIATPPGEDWDGVYIHASK